MLERFDEAAQIADAADSHYRDLTGGERLSEVSARWPRPPAATKTQPHS